jgi:hypothetical protein
VLLQFSLWIWRLTTLVLSRGQIGSGSIHSACHYQDALLS